MGTRQKRGVPERFGRREAARPELLNPIQALGFLALGIESGLRWVSKSMSYSAERVADNLAAKRIEARLNGARALLRDEALRRKPSKPAVPTGGASTP